MYYFTLWSTYEKSVLFVNCIYLLCDEVFLPKTLISKIISGKQVVSGVVIEEPPNGKEVIFFNIFPTCEKLIRYFSTVIGFVSDTKHWYP